MFCQPSPRFSFWDSYSRMWTLNFAVACIKFDHPPRQLPGMIRRVCLGKELLLAPEKFYQPQIFGRGGCWLVLKTIKKFRASAASPDILGIYTFREGVKKPRVFYGQADRKGWPPPSLRSFFCDFFFKGWIMIICILKRILHQKSNIWYRVGLWPFLSVWLHPKSFPLRAYVRLFLQSR